MSAPKVTFAGSERQPVGTRVADQPNGETIDVSVILKPKVRAMAPYQGGVRLSREQFAARHGADSAVIEKLRQFAKENHLTVGDVSPERRTVHLEGTAANLIRAFEVNLDQYEYQGHRYRACTGAIKLPADLADSVEAVLGLDNRPQARTHFRVRGEGARPASTSAAVSYSPRQVAELYQFPLDVDGTGETVGILELGGGYQPADLKNYFASLGISEPTVIVTIWEG